MDKVRNVLYAIISLLMIACGSSDPESATDRHVTFNNDDQTLGFNDGYLIYHNNNIKLVTNVHNEREYVVQELQQQKNNMIFRAKKIPLEMYLLKEKEYSNEALDSMLLKLTGEQIFYFEFEGTTNLLKEKFPDNQEEAISYMSFNIHHDFAIKTISGDTIKPNFAIYEQSFGLTPYERLIIDFSDFNIDEEFQLIYKDNLFGNGQFVFDFPNEKLVKNNLNSPA